jgi:hypothetical protein
MTIRNAYTLVGVSIFLLSCGSQATFGQQAPPDSAVPAATAQAEPSDLASDKEKKAAILDSDCWRRAMFELNEWFRSQTVYTQEEVADMRADFEDQVDQMSAKELKDVLSDLEAKFRIMDTPEVREVRAWFGRYISLLADWRREELLRDIPNFATMTASQLNEEIMKIQRKKNLRANSNRNRRARVDTHLQANRAPQAVSRNPSTQRPAYRSPYRPVSRERPFDDVQIGPRRTMNIDPYGRIFMNLGF